MSWVLMDEYPAGVDLFLVQSSHELHVPYPFGERRSLVFTRWTERLELAERDARGASDEDERLLLIHIPLRSAAILFAVEVPARGEVHSVPHPQAKLGRLQPHSGWRKHFTHVNPAQSFHETGDLTGLTISGVQIRMCTRAPPRSGPRFKRPLFIKISEEILRLVIHL